MFLQPPARRRRAPRHQRPHPGAPLAARSPETILHPERTQEYRRPARDDRRRHPHHHRRLRRRRPQRRRRGLRRGGGALRQRPSPPPVPGREHQPPHRRLRRPAGAPHPVRGRDRPGRGRGDRPPSGWACASRPATRSNGIQEDDTGRPCPALTEALDRPRPRLSPRRIRRPRVPVFRPSAKTWPTTLMANPVLPVDQIPADGGRAGPSACAPPEPT